MNLQTLHSFEDEICKIIPNFRVAFKDESWVQKVLAFLVYPFNPTYMTKFASTYGSTVYFPSRSYYEGQPYTNFTILAHELVHIIDAKNHPFWFPISYVFPQVFALIPLVAYGVVAGSHAWPLAVAVAGLLLGCALARTHQGLFWAALLLTAAFASTMAVMCTGWSSVLFFVGFALLAPWPAPGRVRWELRGYAANIAVVSWGVGVAPRFVREMSIRHFLRADYYFMSWSRISVERKLDEAVTFALNDASPYDVIHGFINNHHA